MIGDASPTTGGPSTADHRGLAGTLAPVLNQECEGRLGPIVWFKADWQRGGAATGTSTWRAEDGLEIPVVLKMPVVSRELLWLSRLQEPADPEPVVPRLYASGSSVGGYDLTWVVMERFEHGPLGLHWAPGHIPRVARAAARFQAQAATFEVDQPGLSEPWDDLLAEATESVRVNGIRNARKWKEAIKTIRARLDDALTVWDARDDRQWLHGDMHLANAMSRTPDGAVSLIDLAEVHAGSWIEDAVYLERQFWARPERIREHKPVREIAAARRELGLPVEPDYPRLAAIRRLLLASSAPRFLKSEGNPKHLEACLAWIERGLGELK